MQQPLFMNWKRIHNNARQPGLEKQKSTWMSHKKGVKKSEKAFEKHKQNLKIDSMSLSTAQKY